MKLVLDTNVLVSGLRSRSGASNPLLIAGFRGQFDWVCSVPLFYEYEDVLSRAELLLDAGISRDEAGKFLDAVARVVVPMEVNFRWRPQLRDSGDEMVLEAAVAGGVEAIVTHNARDFGLVPEKFGVLVWSPGEAMRRMSI
ncbi:putative toxin-antitoxin system toxin component, PIN family [Hasllibacter sp. MH4015]|uniref:putative toxin-antitoxin system toxin component, PIN family n=1 Tax=Hasllibacter sp. MH4015 TaxID=2854029 RepID=UPI001CD36C45|nr:putative toxin-antitoxin system toxin component, PIN family [Hasllibacter sp. MH4015]